MPYRCVALLDTGSPQTVIRRDVLDGKLLVGAASAACERPCSPHSWGGFGESAPLRPSTSIRLSVHFFRDNEPMCSLALWACVLPPSVMQLLHYWVAIAGCALTPVRNALSPLYLTIIGVSAS